MAKDIKFYVDQAGVQEAIYHGDKIKNLEREVMEQALVEARAAFLQDFGYAGALVLEFKYEKVGGRSAVYIPSGTRPSYRIVAGDKRTAATLKQNPGWLARFAKNAKL